jgi:hypothetical protein
MDSERLKVLDRGSMIGCNGKREKARCIGGQKARCDKILTLKK